MAAQNALSQDDIARLMTDRSASAQMDVVGKLTSQYINEGDGEMTDSQAGIANDIFQLLLSRAEVQVRSMLAMNLSQTHKLPPEIARKMASDVGEVAGPILEHSKVLTDEDLIAIIKADADTDKLKAIARRENVSENVSDSLVNTRIEAVVSTLVQNETAAISDTTFEKIAENHNESADVMESMLQRNAMPVAMVEKVIARLSDTMRKNMEQKFGDLAEMKEMRKALEQSLELASLKMLGFKSSNQELIQLINSLEGTNKLSPFSALSMGNLQLFEVSLSRMLRVPLKNIQTLLQDPEGLKAAYLRAELPESLFEAVQLAVRAIRELEQESVAKTGHKEMCSPYHVMERMRMLSEDQEIEGADYMYAMMQQCVRRNIRHQTGAA